MQQQFSSLSEILKYFSNLTEQTINILLSINNAMFTNQQTISINLLDNNGQSFNYTIPSFSYINNKLSEINLNLQKISNIGKRANGLPNFSIELISEPKTIEKVIGPVQFYSKPNYFFENLLNPLLYINIDVSDYITPNTFKIIAKRILIKIDDTDTELLTWFDTNFNTGNNQLIYNDVISLIESKNVQYNIDEEILDLPPISLKNSGLFTVIQQFADIIQDSTYSYVRKYQFSTLNYMNNILNTQQSLQKGDTLILSNSDSEFIVLDIPDSVNNYVVLALKTGFDLIDILDINKNILNIASEPIGKKYFELPVSFNENQIVFLKSIDPYFNTTSYNFGKGFAFKSKDLQIQTVNGLIDFNTYYNNNVFDFGKQFLHLETDDTIAISDGIVPNTIFLNSNNFSVQILNSQRFTTDINQKITTSLAQKQTLESQKSELNSKIFDIDNQLKLPNSLTETKILELHTQQIKYITDLNIVMQQIQSNSLELSNAFTYFNENIAPKYAVVGAFAIPEAIVNTKTRPQNIIQFNIRYQYLTADGKLMPSNSYTYTDLSGNKITITDNNWNYFSTKIRYKQIDSTGQIIWSDMNDPINKLQISINTNETVRFQIQSVSEVGYPDQRFISLWSSPIDIQFPNDQFITDPSTLVYKQLLEVYFKNEYFKELSDLSKLVNILSTNLTALQEQVINMSNT